VNVLAHLPLDQLSDQMRGKHDGRLRFPAYDDVARRLEVDHRGRGLLSDRALEDDRSALLVNVGDARVGGTEVNSVCSHVTSPSLRCAGSGPTPQPKARYPPKPPARNPLPGLRNG